jgi:hypothetical protein
MAHWDRSGVEAASRPIRESERVCSELAPQLRSDLVERAPDATHASRCELPVPSCNCCCARAAVHVDAVPHHRRVVHRPTLDFRAVGFHGREL